MSQQSQGRLVLSRHKDEVVMIGEDIEVCVIEIRPGKVRLGFRAPADIDVHRLEVFKAIRRAAAESLAAKLNEVGLHPNSGEPWTAAHVLADAAVDDDCDQSLRAEAQRLRRAKRRDEKEGQPA
jgi:carbon storage regulator